MPELISPTLSFELRGDCMQPLLAHGDRVWARRRDFDGMLPGEIAVFARFEGGRPFVVAHRLLGKSDGRMLTRADSRVRGDEPLERKDFIGSLVAFRRAGRLASLGDRRTRFYDCVSRLYARFIFAAGRERLIEPLIRQGRDRLAGALRALLLAPMRLLFSLMFPRDGE